MYEVRVKAFGPDERLMLTTTDYHAAVKLAERLCALLVDADDATQDVAAMPTGLQFLVTVVSQLPNSQPFVHWASNSTYVRLMARTAPGVMQEWRNVVVAVC